MSLQTWHNPIGEAFQPPFSIKNIEICLKKIMGETLELSPTNSILFVYQTHQFYQVGRKALEKTTSTCFSIFFFNFQNSNDTF
jgi:hypothetical protein